MPVEVPVINAVSMEPSIALDACDGRVGTDSGRYEKRRLGESLQLFRVRCQTPELFLLVCEFLDLMTSLTTYKSNSCDVPSQWRTPE